MPSHAPVRDLLLVDDHPIILLAVKSLIESKLPQYRLHSAATRSEALQVAGSVKPALALVDLTLPDGDGLDLIRDLKSVAPDCGVLVFSMQCELRFGPRALKAGARGYLMKGDRVTALFDAIQQIEAGRIYCSPALHDKMVRVWSQDSSGGVEALTDREFQVFRLMGEGRPTREIAHLLGISSKTVDSHRENIKTKLKCSSSTEIMLQARDWLGAAAGRRLESREAGP
jgi:DNA-binding NarL/FixJ family response regulator